MDVGRLHQDGPCIDLVDLNLFIPSTSDPTMTDFAHLLPPSWKPQITAWLSEDTPSFDYGGYVVGEVQRTAYLLGKGDSEAVLAGVPFFTEVFNQLGCECVPLSHILCDRVYTVGRVEWHMKEGGTFQPVKHVATVRGKARHLLLGERVALNMLARCSGIATKCDSTTIYGLGHGFTRGCADRKESMTSPGGTDTKVWLLEQGRRRQASTWDP